MHGLDQGRVYPIDRDIIRIGGIVQDGGQKNDIVIRDVEHMVSRFHCEVVKKNGEFFLVDTNSSNGTSVNGEPALPRSLVPLRKGSKIDLGGSTVLQFDFEKKKQTV
jgi:pSer/pThr/pTyr-binding forkhead associated (FHA) protein